MASHFMREGIIDSKSTAVIIFCFAYLIGAALFSLPALSNQKIFFHPLIICSLLALLGYFWQQPQKRHITITLIFLWLGIVQSLQIIPDPKNPHSTVSFNGQKVELTGWIAEEPIEAQNATRYVISVDSIGEFPVNGRAQVTAPRFPRYTYGDNIRINCKLDSPKSDDGSSYRQYLATQGIFSLCNFPRITPIHLPNRGAKIMRAILTFKQIIRARVENLFQEPGSSLLAGLLYGERSGLSKQLTESFNRAGISHIVAISGYNISVIVVIFLALGISAGLHRRQAIWASIGGIVLFTIFTGASASVVRASVMGCLALLAQLLGRPINPGRVLIYTATIMAMNNPYILVWDVGFQLSFMATWGLMYLSPFLEQTKILRAIPDSLAPIKEVLLATLSATIATLPIIAHTFGRVSLVAPVTNILVLWIIPWLMLFGTGAVIISFLSSFLALPIVFITSLGLWYVILTAEWFGALSFAAITVPFPAWLTLVSYLALLLFVYTAPQPLDITPPHTNHHL